MKMAVFLLGVMMYGHSALAQVMDSAALRKYYNEHALFWSGSWNKYRLNGKSYPFRQMEEVVRFSPKALLEYQKFMRNRKTTVVLLTVSTSLLVGSIFVEDRNAKIGLAMGSVFTAGIALPFARGWTNHLNRAIWIHNRDMLLIDH